jgi:phosphinothricin acetyltransferase
MQTIRNVNLNDAARVSEIYSYYVSNTVISFETEPPSVQEIENRIQLVTNIKKLPYLVCTVNDYVVGYAYASTYKDRIAYQWSVEVTVYVDRSFHGQGVGKNLYKKLLETLVKLGYKNAFAIIAVPNTSSTVLHEKFGFHLIGTAKNAGYKSGAWRDVATYQLELSPIIDNAEPVLPLPYNSN